MLLKKIVYFKYLYSFFSHPRVWGMTFIDLKERLTSAPILATSSGTEDFLVYCDTSKNGLRCVYTQNEKVIAYASKQLN